MARFGDPQTENQVNRAKKVNYLALLVLFALLATSFYFFLELQSKKAELLEKTQMLADSTDYLRRIRSELEAAQRDLQAREDSAMNLIENVHDLVEQHEYKEAGAAVTSFRNKGQLRSVNANLYTFGVSEAEKKAVERFLATENVHLTIDTSLQRAPSWLNNQCTVYYYDAPSESTAKRLAMGLSGMTKLPFNAVLGPESEVPPYTRGKYLNIHFVNPSKVIQQKQIQSKIFQEQVLK